MTKAEQLAKLLKDFYKEGYNRGIWECDKGSFEHMPMALLQFVVTNQNTIDSILAQSDMVKFAEWCSKNYILRIRGTWHTHGNHCQDLTTTDLLKIFKELNKGE